MAIRFIDTSSQTPVVRTANDVAPLDCGMAKPLPKIPKPLPKIDDNFGNAVNIGNAGKRGRPRKEGALTAAEKQRRYRERKRAAAS